MRRGHPWDQYSEDNMVAREHLARQATAARLAAVKPCIDTRPPPSLGMPHLSARLKKKQSQEEQQEAIARENRRLLGQMLTTMERDPRGQEAISAPPGTLHLLTRPRNERVQRQEVDRINRENKALLERLRAVRGFIDVGKMEDDYAAWLHRRQNLSRFHLRRLRAAALDAAERQAEARQAAQEARQAAQEAAGRGLGECAAYGEGDEKNVMVGSFDAAGVVGAW